VCCEIRLGCEFALAFSLLWSYFCQPIIRKQRAGKVTLDGKQPNAKRAATSNQA